MARPNKEALALKAGLNARIPEHKDKRDGLRAKIVIHNQSLMALQVQRDALTETIAKDEALLVSAKPVKARAPKKDGPDA